MSNDSIFGDVIDVYSTKDAIADGFLVPVNPSASKEAGIKFPVYLSRAAWDKYVVVPKGFEHEQDESGRLWDVLYMFAHKAKRTSGDSLNFTFICLCPCGDDWERHEQRVPRQPLHREVTLFAQIRAYDFDDHSPAIFIMKPGED